MKTLDLLDALFQQTTMSRFHVLALWAAVGVCFFGLDPGDLVGTVRGFVP